MKKITAIVLTAAMSLSCAAVSVQAAGRVDEVSKVYTSDEINILYNGKLVKSDVKPVNTEGRVMIPFRAALENMGAIVDYDNSQRLVTAKKGDTEIKFTLMEDTIYINKNGEQSTITMDVPMIIVDDWTLVPIRFMSNALNMQVGWDGETETVIIMDYGDYYDEFLSVAPNMKKLMELKQPEYNKEYTAFDFAMNVEDKGAGEKVDLALSGDINMVSKDNAASADMKLNFDFNDAVGNQKYQLKDADAKLIVKDGQLYVKVKLGTPIDEQWYKLDLNSFVDSLSMPEEAKNILKRAVSTGSFESNEDIMRTLFGGFEDVSKDATLDMAQMHAVQMDMYETIDKYFTITEKENGGYSVSFSMDKNDLFNMMLGAMGLSVSGDEDLALEIAELFKGIDFTGNISITIDCDGTKAESEAKVNIGYKDENSSFDFRFNMTDKCEKAETVENIEIPTDCKDISELLKLLQNN